MLAGMDNPSVSYLNLFEISPHFVVELSEPIRDPEFEMASRPERYDIKVTQPQQQQKQRQKQRISYVSRARSDCVELPVKSERRRKQPSSSSASVPTENRKKV